MLHATISFRSQAETQALARERMEQLITLVEPQLDNGEGGTAHFSSKGLLSLTVPDSTISMTNDVWLQLNTLQMPGSSHHYRDGTSDHESDSGIVRLKVHEAKGFI